MNEEMPNPNEFARTLISSFLNGEVSDENMNNAITRATEVVNNELKEFPMEAIMFWINVKNEIAKIKQN